MEVDIFMNIKKIIRESTGLKRSFFKLISSRGFHTVLVFCIICAGTAAILIAVYNMTSSMDYDVQKLVPEEKINQTANKSIKQKEEQPANKEENISQSAQSSIASVSINNKGIESKEEKSIESKEGKSIEPKEAEKSTINVNTNNKSDTNWDAKTKLSEYIMPVSGEVIFDYSNDKLVYSKTLNEWRVHNGIDIASVRGTPVLAAFSGVVSKVETDSGLGIMVTIKQDDGNKAIYANLASSETVTFNQKVKQGDIIGSIGNTASFEALEPPHLHFEVHKNNEPVNPKKYLPKVPS